MKKEFANNLKWETYVMSRQWALVTQSQGRVNEFEARAKEGKDQVAICTKNIWNRTKQVDELQWKIEEVKQNKTKIETSRLAPIEEILV